MLGSAKDSDESDDNDGNHMHINGDFVLNRAMSSRSAPAFTDSNQVPNAADPSGPTWGPPRGSTLDRSADGLTGGASYSKSRSATRTLSSSRSMPKVKVHYKKRLQLKELQEKDDDVVIQILLQNYAMDKKSQKRTYKELACFEVLDGFWTGTIRSVDPTHEPIELQSIDLDACSFIGCWYQMKDMNSYLWYVGKKVNLKKDESNGLNTSFILSFTDDKVEEFNLEDEQEAFTNESSDNKLHRRLKIFRDEDVSKLRRSIEKIRKFLVDKPVFL
eukprot:747199-Hanusia_phi.AAC.1